MNIVLRHDFVLHITNVQCITGYDVPATARPRYSSSYIANGIVPLSHQHGLRSGISRSSRDFRLERAAHDGRPNSSITRYAVCTARSAASMRPAAAGSWSISTIGEPVSAAQTAA